jgi:hypothetical protein
MLANADAYTANQLRGTGHIRVAVNPESVKVDFVRAYLPADVKAGVRQNQEIGFTYTIGKATPNVVLANQQEPKEWLSIKPNPANDIIEIQVNRPFQRASFSLYNQLGARVLTSESPQLLVKNLPEGTYVLSAEIDEEIRHQKILIKH